MTLAKDLEDELEEDLHRHRASRSSGLVVTWRGMSAPPERFSTAAARHGHRM